jgi:hypothetical protein
LDSLDAFPSIPVLKNTTSTQTVTTGNRVENKTKIFASGLLVNPEEENSVKKALDRHLKNPNPISVTNPVNTTHQQGFSIRKKSKSRKLSKSTRGKKSSKRKPGKFRSRSKEKLEES